MLQARDLKAPSKTEDLLQYGAIAARTLKEIAEATGVPCLKAIAGLTMLIIQTVQTVRYNKDECIRMTECIYWLICAIINICKNTEAELSPTMMGNIEQLQDTLQKLLSYVRMHVDAIQHALDVFGVQSHVITAVTLAEMQDHASRCHQEVMNVLSSKQAALPPGTTLEDLRRSSSGLSLLPTLPLTFSGHGKEQQEIITIMQNTTPPRIDILGPGGIGKTSLAISVQHDHNIIDTYGTRRWRQENISLLPDGVDKISSLEKSISMSVSSLRMRNTPDALELLSLLALLPDGILEATLLQMKLPFNNVPKCIFTLVSTSLVYVDGRGRVKALTPIRDYTRTYHPPRNESLQSLNTYVNQILDVWTPNDDYPSQHQIDTISSELGNIYSILDYNLRVAQDYADYSFQTVKAVISLLRLMNQTALGSIDFLLSFSSIIKQLGNQKLRGQILYHLGSLSQRYVTSRDAEKDLQDAYNCFESVGALNEQVMVTISLSYLAEDPIKASNIARKAVSMTTHGFLDIHVRCRAFVALSSALLNSGYINDALHLLQEPEALSRATENLKGELICINIRARAPNLRCLGSKILSSRTDAISGFDFHPWGYVLLEV
ncbi:hypothetical protein BDQ12DRAFT_722486 [Crucibulum laeve]|uniref:NB-ARC domain-containing protein n=1 Tax=Crucibulum laeve TaxID=68775 RepID=A0A5C3MER0_9AGAR|nr:hypothetical protein BDQ12DRAFT_722486 [Crucibulum laeve]